MSVLYELAAPSTDDSIVNQVASGELPADLESIRKAKEALKKAEDEAARLRAETELTQRQLVNVQNAHTIDCVT